MDFKEAVQILGIEQYAERIVKSNSRGELFYLQQYLTLAEVLGKTEWFPRWFDKVVEWAEKTWERPESVFQHIDKILIEDLKN